MIAEIIVLILILAVLVTPFAYFWARHNRKTCPSCAEFVDSRARVCRYCGFWF